MAIDNGIAKDLVTTEQDVTTTVVGTFDHPLFKLGGAQITFGSLLTALVSLLVLIIFTRWMRFWMVNRAFARSHIDVGTRETLATLVHYAVLVIGVITIFQSVGIRLSSFTVLVGAFGVGIGFGL